MTMQFNAMKGYYVRTQDNPPITVDWSTTIQSLSTDLQENNARNALNQRGKP